jgi:hypothetical protein
MGRDEEGHEDSDTIMCSTEVERTGMSSQPWRVDGRHMRSKEEDR